MDLAGLEDLKKKLGTATDFASVFEYFLDHFGEDEEFLKHGERTREPLLEMCVGQVGRQLYGAGGTVDRFLLIAVPGTSFIHGSCLVGGRPANVLYFGDVQVGLLAVLPGRRGEATHCSRFSARQMPPGAVPSRN